MIRENCLRIFSLSNPHSYSTNTVIPRLTSLSKLTVRRVCAPGWHASDMPLSANSSVVPQLQAMALMTIGFSPRFVMMRSTEPSDSLPSSIVTDTMLGSGLLLAMTYIFCATDAAFLILPLARHER